MSEEMTYAGNTPMPDITWLDDPFWFSIPINALSASIRKTIQMRWKYDKPQVMMKTGINAVTVCLYPGTTNAVLLYFN